MPTVARVSRDTEETARQQRDKNDQRARCFLSGVIAIGALLVNKCVARVVSHALLRTATTREVSDETHSARET